MNIERIIVVDDDPRVIKSIQVAFAEYKIIDFSNGKDVVEYLKEPRDIHVVLLDVMMPGMDGLNVLREIKKIRPDISVIIMTAYGTLDVAIQALRSQANDFMEKPFDVEELRKKIKVILKDKLKFNESSRDAESQLDRIKNFIRRNYNNISLENIAEELRLSPKYVSRMFNEKNGFSFRDYKVQVKIDVAKKLLKDSFYNISEISDKLGYQNPESFMRMFKRMTNLTPMQFREKSLNENLITK